jgi:quinolinate synthase
MKLTTLEKAVAALRDGLNEVTVAPAIRERALQAVTRMLE